MLTTVRESDKVNFRHCSVFEQEGQRIETEEKETVECAVCTKELDPAEEIRCEEYEEYFCSGLCARQWVGCSGLCHS